MNLYRKVKTYHLNIVRNFYIQGMASWAYWKLWQIFLNTVFERKPNTLSINGSDDNFNNRLLIKELQECINLSPNNKFTLDVSTLNFIWDNLKEVKPNVILEFGSGVSTFCFNNYFSKYNKKGILITVEQDEAFMKKTIRGIVDLKIKHFPIMTKVDNKGYYLDKKILQHIVNNYGKIDYVLIDGPFGGWKVRQNTLLSIKEFCKNNCIWILDDAFRDSEMEVLKNWMSDKNIHLNGILSFDKGLAKGFIKK